MSENNYDGAQSLEALLDAYLDVGVPQENEIRDGTIVAVRNGDVLVDIGAKSEGILPASETDLIAKQRRAEMRVGASIRVCIINPEDERGNIIVSYLKVSEQEDWERAEAMVESGEIAECEIVGFNRGGVLAMLGSLRGFLPASQLGYAHQISRSQSTEAQLKALIGETATVKVLEADQEKGRLIISEMAAERKARQRDRAQRLAELNENDVCSGYVINLTDFGAFVDIGGIEGLVHSSELSWRHFSKPNQVLSVGDEVEVLVIGVDKERERVTFSIKQLQPNPWDRLEDLYSEGQLVDVTVTQLTRYGAFARIEDDYRLEGLIHISELAEEHVKNPAEVVDKGQRMTARIIRLDGDNQQIGFSLKQVSSQDYVEVDFALDNS